jgi:hypothetical protein
MGLGRGFPRSASSDLLRQRSGLCRDERRASQLYGTPTQEVCIGSKSVLTTLKRDFRNTPDSRHRQPDRPCQFRAKPGHRKYLIRSSYQRTTARRSRQAPPLCLPLRQKLPQTKHAGRGRSRWEAKNGFSSSRPLCSAAQLLQNREDGRRLRASRVIGIHLGVSDRAILRDDISGGHR